MRKSKIFFLASEIYPFVKSGKSGELAGSLPIYLQNNGHEVRVMMPKYSVINERKYIIRDIIRLKDLPVQFTDKTLQVSVKSGFLPESKTQTYYLDYEPYFKRSDLYRDKKTGLPFKDNDQRFVFLAKAAIETLKTLGWQPDLIHCCDWPSGVLAAMIRKEQKQNNFFKKTALVFSVSDFSNAGLFDKSALSLTGIDPGAAELPKFMHGNKFSFLKTGLQSADAVMISSYEKRFKNLTQPKTDVEKVIATAKNIFDVPGGANYQLWNPNSNALTKSYSVEKYYRRKANREAFIEDRRTGFKAEDMIIGILTEQFDEDAGDIVDFLKSIKDQPVQILILSDKNPVSHNGFKQHASKTQGHRIHTIVDTDDQMKPLFYSVCDIFYTPGTDYYAQRHNLNGIHYGAIPVIAKQSDTAALFEPIQLKTMSGHAVIFDSKKDIASSLAELLAVYANTEKWEPMITKMMKLDLSWNRSLPHVIKVYEKAISRLK